MDHFIQSIASHLKVGLICIDLEHSHQISSFYKTYSIIYHSSNYILKYFITRVITYKFIKVVDFALHNTQRAAARKYGVAQKRVFAWVLAKDELQEIQNSNNPQKQDVEEVDRLLWKWRKDMIDKGKDVSKRMICAQARFQFKKMGNSNFVGNNQWYNNWIKRIKKKGFQLDIPSNDTESLKNIMEQDSSINESGCS
ncbi:uncharacterized protein LOC111625096 isoform X3 [Centruroides sculpturatus]|uniref:uncharacterized protein LOC111625096 isoform X2 n=1 Tax=Centruroides sculpturatus TaxID=218467 RepID=UPI000C6D2301|nr:uncharacterized protein LOC111625096 isoform X2 [Centruroides sculpturatus]XP_023223897.1 uncharacterized protein LOC111625096 isoform X3 [Centruroides sculpturatus]